MRRVIRVTWLPVIFAVSVAIGVSRGNMTPNAGVAWAGSDTSEERLLVYIGSSTCGYANVDEITGLIGAIRERVRASASERRRFVMVGISKDHDVNAGLNHLAKFAPFDEVMTGRNWANIGILKYVYGELRGLAATPQVLIVDRRLVNDKTGTRVENEHVLNRASGLKEVRDLASGKTAIAVAAQENEGLRPRPARDAAVPE